MKYLLILSRISLLIAWNKVSVDKLSKSLRKKQSSNHIVNIGNSYKYEVSSLSQTK